MQCVKKEVHKCIINYQYKSPRYTPKLTFYSCLSHLSQQLQRPQAPVLPSLQGQRPQAREEERGSHPEPSSQTRPRGEERV